MVELIRPDTIVVGHGISLPLIGLGTVRKNQQKGVREYIERYFAATIITCPNNTPSNTQHNLRPSARSYRQAVGTPTQAPPSPSYSARPPSNAPPPDDSRTSALHRRSGAASRVCKPSSTCIPNHVPLLTHAVHARA